MALPLFARAEEKNRPPGGEKTGRNPRDSLRRAGFYARLQF